MKTELIKKGDHFILVPASNISEEEREKALKYIAGIKEGEVIQCEIKRTRNIKFHNKYFSLLMVGYECIDVSGLMHNGQPTGKNFDVFRKDIAVLCGFYDQVFSLNGKGFKLVAKSISFANMEETEFELLYNQTVNKLLERVLPSSYNKESIDNEVNRRLEVQANIIIEQFA